MEDLVVIKTDKDLGSGVMSGIAKAVKATVVCLPLSCTITTKEAALKELQNYKDVLERFCK